MKANELKATDLMVGDLVQIKEKDGKKLVGAFRVVAIGKTYLGGVISDFVENGTVSISYIEERRVYQTEVSNIELIPLTPEILKKNGFGCDRNDGYAILILEDNSELMYYFHEYKLTMFYKSEIIFRCQCVYVHQLQHALRLCGIDKEIVV